MSHRFVLIHIWNWHIALGAIYYIRYNGNLPAGWRWGVTETAGPPPTARPLSKKSDRHHTQRFILSFILGFDFIFHPDVNFNFNFQTSSSISTSTSWLRVWRTVPTFRKSGETARRAGFFQPFKHSNIPKVSSGSRQARRAQERLSVAIATYIFNIQVTYISLFI